jgi:hypothetical protein
MEVSDKLESYWREAMKQPAHQLVSKFDLMLQAAGILPVEGDVFRDPLFQQACKTEYRQRIQQRIANWRQSGPFSTGYDSIVYDPSDPVAACRSLSRIEQEDLWRASGPVSMPTLIYVQCQEELCYQLLSRGVGERQIAADTNLDVLEVREIANRHNITTHL